ncbi:SPFH domain-containing protein [[Mycoplasma] testudinis]|uniref:SPFH domain-containing protein n=1 Tax=[Mycoplasma] testudinis TaxID=33924 RepID=UPI00047FBFB7|nr:SPFH domain-containing protein [[Mycoplasma] testudinis]
MLTAGAIVGIVIATIVFLLFILIIATSVKIVNQSNFYIIERLGSFHKTWEKGLHFLRPFIDRIVKKETYKEKVMNFPEQSIITSDNATVKVDTVCYLEITDGFKYTYGVEDAIKAIENLVATTLRNYLGEKKLDETLVSRQELNERLTATLDLAGNQWGIKVKRVELKNIVPPASIQMAMEKQMQSEREKRAMVTIAEGRRDSAIFQADGEQTAMIKVAEGKKQAQILEAEGKRQATELLLSAKIDERVLTWMAIDKIDVLANGTATKIIIPPNLQSIASIMATAVEIGKPPKTII